MSVRKQKRTDTNGRTNEFWIVDVKYRHRDGKIERVRKVPRRQTRAAAEKLEREIVDALEKGIHFQTQEKEASEAVTLAAFSEEFMENYACVNNKMSERQTKQTILKLYLLPAFGDRSLEDITSRDVENYKAKRLAEGLAAKTINNHLAVLRKVLRVAAEWGLTASDPAIRPLKVAQPQVRFLTFEDSAALLNAVAPEWRAMTAVALNTGLRQGELLALKWDHVDLATGRIVVRENDWKGTIGTPKGGRIREIPLNQTVRTALLAHQHARGPLVFCHPDGRRLTYQQCRRPLMRACEKAGIESVQWHSLRHTFASHLVMRGVPLKAVQELLGHSTLAMTERYAHLTPDVRRDAVELLDNQSGQRRGNANQGENTVSVIAQGQQRGNKANLNKKD